MKDIWTLLTELNIEGQRASHHGPCKRRHYGDVDVYPSWIAFKPNIRLCEISVKRLRVVQEAHLNSSSYALAAVWDWVSASCERFFNDEGRL